MESQTSRLLLLLGESQNILYQIRHDTINKVVRTAEQKAETKLRLDKITEEVKLITGK